MTKYVDLVRQLYSANLYLRVKMGLQNIQRLHAGLQNPLDKVNTVVHVAGPNGKGSVCLKVARALQESGLRTGLFVSPHISCFRERMQVNGDYITEEQVEQLLPLVMDVIGREKIPGTFFEITTALSLLYYAEMKAQAVVLETGLGGRLDSTNICKPSVTVITSISKDHTKILGSTEQEIAVEKGGIFKPNVPVVLGPIKNQRTIDTLLELAHRVGAGPVHLVEPLSVPSNVSTNSFGARDFVLENEKIASAVINVLRENGEIQITDHDMKQAMALNPPCRFQEVTAFGNIPFVLDVAHNPEALTKFFDRFVNLYGLASMDNVQIIIGMSVDKDLEECMKVLKRYKPENILLVKSNHPRAAPVKSLASHLPGAIVMEPGQNDSSIPQGISLAIERSRNTFHNINDTAPPIIICGSLYIMDEVLQVLGASQEDQQDPFIVQQAWVDRKVGKEPTTTNAQDLQSLSSQISTH
jgi:dihydrofolate synthase/folylpolyglutamate synthase